MIRKPTIDDISDLARIHVQAWQETYSGLLPDAEIARFDLPFRERQWAGALVRADTRIAYAPSLGFAQIGPQRDTGLADDYPEELYAIYLLDRAKGLGLGRKLLGAVAGKNAFTALVLAGNDRALAFYGRMGGQDLMTRSFEDNGLQGLEHVIGWVPPFDF